MFRRRRQKTLKNAIERGGNLHGILDKMGCFFVFGVFESMRRPRYNALDTLTGVYPAETECIRLDLRLSGCDLAAAYTQTDKNDLRRIHSRVSGVSSKTECIRS